MKLGKLTLLLLASTLAVSSCGKTKKADKAEDGSKDALNTAGKTPPGAAPVEGPKPEAKPEAPKTFTVIGGETPASKLFANLMKVDDKTNAAQATLPLLAKKFEGDFSDEVVLSVVETVGDNSKMKLDNLIGNSKLWSTDISGYTQAEKKLDKKSLATAYKLTTGDQPVTLSEKEAAKTAGEITGTAVKLEKDNEVVYSDVIPTVAMDVSKIINIVNLVLDLGKDPVAAPIELIAESKVDCFITAKNDVVPAGLILTKIINGKTIDFSKLNKEELAKLPTDKEIAAYFVCGAVEAKEDNKLTTILFAQKAMKLTIKSAPVEVKKEEKPAAEVKK